MIDIKHIRHILTDNILPYWTQKMVDPARGGFYGRITGEEQLMEDSEKGAILNARILWTLSASCRVLKLQGELATLATRAKDYLIEHFIDNEFGGVYWSVDCEGKPLDQKKQTYAIGFAIYGLSEYARATGDKEALEMAISLYRDLEQHAYDPIRGGYFEAFQRDWQPIADMRLSEKDDNACKTMNTHLHVLEPYTNLHRALREMGLAEYKEIEKQVQVSIERLINVFQEHILDRDTYHLNLFFDEAWHCQSHIISYGHDIEASWLLDEAALEIGLRIDDTVKRIAAVAAEGLTPNGGMIYECLTSHKDSNYHWWVQAETIVGYMNLYQRFGDEDALQKAEACLSFTDDHIIDYDNGEWLWSVDEHLQPNRKDDKAGFWKCPYHNGRMCLELIERFANNK